MNGLMEQRVWGAVLCGLGSCDIGFPLREHWLVNNVEFTCVRDLSSTSGPQLNSRLAKLDWSPFVHVWLHLRKLLIISHTVHRAVPPYRTEMTGSKAASRLSLLQVSKQDSQSQRVRFMLLWDSAIAGAQLLLPHCFSEFIFLTFFLSALMCGMLNVIDGQNNAATFTTFRQ